MQDAVCESRPAAECMAAAAAAAAAEVTKFNVIQLRAPGCHCKLVSAYTVYPVTTATPVTVLVLGWV